MSSFQTIAVHRVRDVGPTIVESLTAQWWLKWMWDLWRCALTDLECLLVELYRRAPSVVARFNRGSRCWSLRARMDQPYCDSCYSWTWLYHCDEWYYLSDIIWSDGSDGSDLRDLIELIEIEFGIQFDHRHSNIQHLNFYKLHNSFIWLLLAFLWHYTFLFILPDVKFYNECLWKWFRLYNCY